MFNTWHLMTDGDALDYERANETLAAMRKVVARAPWKAKDMRAAMNMEARKIAAPATRYEL